MDNEKTAAALLGRRLSERHPACRIEVLNAGVPGWTSSETLINFRLRILKLYPDVIVIIDGRNDVFPQLFNNYRDDYSHFRVSDYQFRNSNYAHKLLFRASHLFMLIATGRGGLFGFSWAKENPVYGSIQYSNQPTVDDLLRNMADVTRTNGFRSNLRQVVRLAKGDRKSVV